MSSLELLVVYVLISMVVFTKNIIVVVDRVNEVNLLPPTWILNIPFLDLCDQSQKEI